MGEKPKLKSFFEEIDKELIENIRKKIYKTPPKL